MNRLLLRPIARALWAQRLPAPHHCLNVSFIASPCRQFASSSSLRASITQSEQQLSTLLASGMQQDDLAKEIAGLFARTEEDWLLLQLEDQLIKHTNKTGERQLLKKFNSYLHEIEVEAKAQKAVEATEAHKSGWFSPEAQAALSRRGLDLTQYVAELLELPSSAKVITTLTPKEIDQFEEIWVQFDQEKTEIWLHKIVDFFAARGVNFVPPQNYTETTFGMTPEEFARKSAADGSWSPTYAPVSREQVGDFPDLMMSDSILDPRDVLDLPPSTESPFHNRVTIFNHRSVFHDYSDPLDNALASEVEKEMNSYEDLDKEVDGEMESYEEMVGKADSNEGNGVINSSKESVFSREADSSEAAEAPEVDEFTKALPVPKSFYTGLHQSILMRRAVVQQTGKGKIRRISFMVLVGNGDGLVGYGEGKHANSMVALAAARLAAVRNMDWVERFEKRTVWTEMKTKLGATQLILRPRPVGFGLRCNPYLHQILRAAGFKDISAKVWGSRNRLNVIKAAFRMIQAGHAPTGMGDGMGGPGKKLNRGRGLRSMSELERARGRKLISLRK